MQFLAKNNNKHRNRLFISSDEKLAQSTVMHLEQKLKQVDDLLESMQEEEWKDEEEGLLLDRDEDDFDGNDNGNEVGDENDNGNDNDVDNDVDNHDSDVQASILHPILAMILGALPDHGKSPEEHFSYLKKVHTEIVVGWKKEFGRLPPLSDDNENEI